MVDTEVLSNGDAAPAAPRHDLPALIHLDEAESRRIPSPGTQRALKAETGHTYEELAGPTSNSADRFQTLIWSKLRRDFPGLRWAECADVEVQVDEGVSVDPTRLEGSENSQPSAASGG